MICKCGSVKFFTEVKGNNTGLYCAECGKWIKWLTKDEIRDFENQEKDYPPYLDRPKIHVRTIEDRLREYLHHIIKEIDSFVIFSSSGVNDMSNYCLEETKDTLTNILDGKEWNEVE